MSKKNTYTKSRWLEGVHMAEMFMKEGWLYNESDSTYNEVHFKHPEGGTHCWIGLGDFNRGMMAYVEHRKLNGEIYGCHGV